MTDPKKQCPARGVDRVDGMDLVDDWHRGQQAEALGMWLAVIGAACDFFAGVAVTAILF